MEREFHQWLYSQTARQDSILIGLGDDAAVIHGRLFGCPEGAITVTTDAIAEGVHFDSTQHELEQIGWKAMGVNFSDLAAMGGTPIAAVVTLLVPKQFELQHLQRLFAGCRQMADRYQVSIIGGDTNRWSGALVVSVTAIGKQPWLEGRPVIWGIDGARPGDKIVVTGSFGGSLIKKHFSFSPRIELAQYLAANFQIQAATDVSDSLSLDLQLLADASGKKRGEPIGVEINASQVPVSADAHHMSQSSQWTPLQHALFDGEDFELVLAIDPVEWKKIQQDLQLSQHCQTWGGLTEIGCFTAISGFKLNTPAGWESITPQGYTH